MDTHSFNPKGRQCVACDTPIDERANEGFVELRVGDVTGRRGKLRACLCARCGSEAVNSWKLAAKALTALINKDARCG